MPKDPDTDSVTPRYDLDIFKIEAKQGSALKRKVIACLGKPVGYTMGLHLINNIYNNVTARSCQEDFLDKTLDFMNVEYRVSDDDLTRIPRQGPAVVVANHPFGAIEGVIIMHLLSKIRPDFKVMGNYFLRLIPQLRDRIIFVDNFGRADSLRQNIGPMKECLRCLRNGHLLAIFPAGEVSHVMLRKRRIMDPAWLPSVSRIIHRTQVPALPIYFHGRNTMFFQILGMVHPMLRTMMLPREFANKCHSTIDLSVGSLIPYKKLAVMQQDVELINYLRLRTYILKQRYAEEVKRVKLLPAPVRLPSWKQPQPEKPVEEVAPPVLRELLLREVASLPSECLLHESGDFQVYAAPGELIPKVLEEIGRLREFTFRLVGEGTGRDKDLDRFDHYYDHLFILNNAKQEIVGAYRMGKTDEILAERGIEGLYTSTLFNFKPQLFERMGKALEMGRSFVRPEYQKSFSALFLLWKGIGSYVLRNPDHITLFGPVSVSNEYSPTSKELIVRYLKSKDSFSKFHKYVKPRTPPKYKSLKRHEVREFRNAFKTVEDVTEVITDLESEFKGIPVLLRQYLKLGGKVLAFNVDPDFQDCLDGLIVVNVLRTPQKILANYMGKENVALLHEYHKEKARLAALHKA
jgi:putative hemolysin